ncbi:hypothetical protein, partial [Streptomyces sp. NPDC003514]
EYGARPLRRTIQREVDNQLSRLLLDGRIGEGVGAAARSARRRRRSGPGAVPAAGCAGSAGGGRRPRRGGRRRRRRGRTVLRGARPDR